MFFFQKTKSEFRIAIALSVVLWAEIGLFGSVRAEISAAKLKVTNITACLLIERGNPRLLYDYDKSAAAIDLAVSYVNDYILPASLRLRTVYSDIGDSCSGKNQILRFGLELWQRGVECAVYIGPGCGIAAENLYSFADFLDTPIIGCPAADLGTFAPASDYPLLARISISSSSTAKVLFRFFDRFNYTNLVFFQDTHDLFYGPMGDIVLLTMRSLRNDLLYSQKTKFVQFNSSKSKPEDYRNMLVEAHQSSRVYTIFGNSRIVRNFMIEAGHLGFTDGNAIFIAVALFDSPEWGNFSWTMGDRSDSEAFEAYQSLVIFGLEESVSSVLDIFEQEVVRQSSRKYNHTYNAKNDLNPIVSHFYDAIILFGNIVRDSMANGMDYLSLNGFSDMVTNYSFVSPLNGKVQMDENMDRSMNYVLQNFDPITGKHQVAFSFNSDGRIKRLSPRLNWPNRTSGFPPDVPECGFKHDKCKPQIRLMSAGEKAGLAIGLVFCCAMLFFSGYYIKKYCVDQLADPYWWRIFVSDLYIFGQNGISGISLANPQSVSRKSRISGENSLNPTEDPDVSEEEKSAEKIPKFAIYNGATVSLQELPEPKPRSSPAIVHEAALIRGIQHSNLQKVIGIAINDDNLCDYIVGEDCRKGSISDLVLSQTLGVDWPFKHSLIKDIAAGMAYLHSTRIASTGWLTSHSCLIDSRLVVKISDYAFTNFRKPADLEPPHPHETERDFEMLLWRAPELLRRTMPPRGTQILIKNYCAGDVYSFGILLQQIVLRSMPYRATSQRKNEGEDFKAMEITIEVRKGTTPPMRPRVPVSSIDGELYQLMESCWEESPLNRPTFPRVRLLLKAILGRSGDNLIDHLVLSLDKHARDMEQKIEIQTKLFMEEKARSDYLLQQILPKVIAATLSRGDMVVPEIYQSATVQISDLGEFTDIIWDLSPAVMVNALNKVYTTIDEIIETSDACRLETCNDAVVTVSGIPVPNGGRHAFEMCLMALTMRREIGRIIVGPANENRRFRLRSGVHTGPCLAAIIGAKVPKYCIFGETVYIAQQLKIEGADGEVQVSPVTKEFLDRIGGFPITERGPIQIKGKGIFITYWLAGNT